MSLHRFKKGLRLPLAGTPDQVLEKALSPRRVAVLAADSVGLRPKMHAAVGDDVRRGQLLFEDKKTAGVRYTAPGAGTVVGIHRGARRSLQSVVIELSRAEREGRAPEEVTFRAFTGRHPSGLSSDDVCELLIESGMWVSLRARPFSRRLLPGA